MDEIEPDIDKPIAIDLFCGAGGLSLGFEKAGVHVACGIDKHPDAIQTYLKNRLNYVNKVSFLMEDIQNIKKKNIIKAISKVLEKNREIDVIIGGPPCQGISLRGNRKKNDPRNKLIYEFFRIVNEIRPTLFVFENVSGLLMKNNINILRSIIQRIEKIGYHFSLDILYSADYGVPQNRKRLIIIGCKSNENIIFPRKSNKKDLRKNIDDLNLEPPKYDVVPNIKKKISVFEALDDVSYPNVLKSPINYRKNAKTSYQRLMRKNSNKLYNHITTKHKQISLKIFSMLKSGQGMYDLPLKYRRNRRSAQRMIPSNPSRTITCCNEDFIHYSLDRIITIREMARLQSFPDDYFFFGTRTTGSNRRKFSCCQVQQVGNSVPPLLAQAIAEGVLKMLNRKSNNNLKNLIGFLDKR